MDIHENNMIGMNGKKENKITAKDILENISDGFFALDSEWKFIYINKKAEKLIQRKKSELLGKNVRDCFNDEEANWFYEHYEIAQKTGKVQSFEVHVARVDKWFEMKVFPLKKGLTIYFSDVTSRKNTELLLRESEEKYRTLYETMTQGVVYHDTDGKIISANPAAEKILGLTRSQIQGKTSLDPQWKCVREDMSEFRGIDHPSMVALSTGKPVRHAIMGVFHPKEKDYRWILVNAIPLFRQNEKKPYMVYTTFEDITERKEYVEKMHSRLRLQEAVSHLGLEALSGKNLRMLMQKAVYQLSEILQVEYTKVLELLPDGKRLVLRAGKGWDPQVTVDHSSVGTGKNSQAGYTLLSKKPVIVKDLRTDKRFNGPKLLQSHGVISGMSVILYGLHKPYGVLGVHTKKKREFTKDDIHYLQSVANVLSQAIQRQEAEEELRKSEENFRTVAETIPQMIWVARPDGYHEFYNQRWFEYTGTTFEDTKGPGWNKLFHPKDQERSWNMWKRCLKTGERYEIEYRLFNARTGQYRWVLGMALPVRDAQGNITKWFGTCTDIHEQKQQIVSQEFLTKASTVLGSSLDYKKTLKQVAKLVVPEISDWCTVDILNDGEVELVAVAHKDPKMVKWARELRKKNPVDMNSPTGLPKVLKTSKPEFYPVITDELLVKTAKNKQQLSLLRKVGFKSVMIVPICINEKAVGGITLISTQDGKYFNEQDLKMAEELAHRASLAIDNAQLYESARQNERKFNALNNANIIGVVHSDLHGKIYEANDAFLNMVGYSRNDLENGVLNWKKMTPPEFHDAGNQAMQELLKTGATQLFEKEYIKKDGSQVPVIIGSVLIDKNKSKTITFILDITERKKLEARKDEFIGIASHELKTPLTSIKGYVQILERIISEMGDEKLNTYLKKTNTYVDRLNSLIVDLLDVSKIQSGKLQMNYEKFNFYDLVKEGIENIQHINSQYRIKITGDADQVIYGDRSRLEQVFTNLISNAIKYSPKSDTILVTVTKSNGSVKVAVQDFGVGIPKNKQSQLFQRFYRVEETSKTFSGLGIGLYISSEIIKRHGGKIWVESEFGKGSTFYFTLPRKTGKELAS